MEAMGLSVEPVDYGCVDIEAVADLATLSPKEAAFEKLLGKASSETLRDVVRRITDEKGKPTRGHKARLAAIQARLSEMTPAAREGAEPASLAEREQDPTGQTSSPHKLRQRYQSITAWMRKRKPETADADQVARTLKDLKRLTKEAHRRQTRVPGDIAAVTAILDAVKRDQTRLQRIARSHAHAEGLSPIEA